MTDSWARVTIVRRRGESLSGFLPGFRLYLGLLSDRVALETHAESKLVGKT